MLRIDIRLVPSDGTDRPELLGAVCIANVSRRAEVSDYAVWTINQTTTPGAVPRDWDEALIHRRVVHGHRRADGWGPLIARAMTELFGSGTGV